MRKCTISLVIFIIIISLSLTISYASNNIVNSMDFQGNVIEVDLEEAIHIAMKDNPVLVQSKLDIEQAQVEYDRDIKLVKKLKDIYYDEKESSLVYLENVKLLDMSTNFLLSNAKRVYEATAEALKADMELSYYNLLQAEKLEIINYENLSLSKELFDKTKTKYDLGVATKQEVLNSELNYINASNEYKNAINNLKSAKMNFNIKLGFDVMDNINLKDELTYKEFDMPEIATAIQNALEKRFEIKSAEYVYDIELVNMQITSKKYTEITFAFREQKVKLEKALRNLENTRKNIEMEVRVNYMSVFQKLDEIKASEKAVLLAEQSLKISQIAYDAGLKVLDDVQKAQLSLLQSKLGLSKAILDYNLAVLKFEGSIGVGRR